MRKGRRLPFSSILHRIFTVSRLFLIPAFLLLGLFILYPVVETVYVSFISDRTGNFGLDNYNYVLFQKVNPLINIPNILRGIFPMGALVHNAIWICIHLPLTVLFGLVLAVLLRDVKGGFIIKTIVFLGVVIPLVVGGVLFRYIYDNDAGIVNAFLRLIGLGAYTENFLIYPNTALFAVIIGSIWIWTGFAMVVYSAGLEGIPTEMYESAAIDGASRWKTFWHITVPLLRSSTLVVVTLTVLWELKVFDIVYVATFGGPGGASSVLAFDMWLQAFQAPFNVGAGSAIAVILTILTLGIAAYLVNRMSKS